MAALWFPLVVLSLMVLNDHLNEQSSVALNFETLGMILGVPAYIAFASLEMRLLRNKPEQQVINRIWLGPLIFMPFYAANWMLSRLAQGLSGQPIKGTMLIEWLAYVPTLLIVGCVVSGLTVALYRIFF
ncbi:hypothetical protein HU743_15770 [Pseudomonas sp. SWRI99]|nr:hypothetical protein [Pseudomonas sp. SWRI99]